MQERISEKVKKYNWIELQKISKEKNLSKDGFYKEFGIKVKTLKYAIDNNLINFDYYIRKHTEEYKKMMSVKRTKFLIDNPDKHVWKRNSKFKSMPCEKFKEKLNKNKISFVEEFSPIDKRGFSIDITFPDKKIGIEINGNQHYNSDGTLKEYYQKRHLLIEKEGWKLYEYHYSIIFDELLLNNIIIKLKTDYDLSEIDYSFYIKNKTHKTLKNNCECGNEKYIQAKSCGTCSNLKSRKVKDRPSVDELLIEISESSYSTVARKYGVSDTCIRKWLGDKLINKQKSRRKGKPKCIDCGIEIDYGSKERCNTCNRKISTKIFDVELLIREYEEFGLKFCINKYKASKGVIYKRMKLFKNNQKN